MYPLSFILVMSCLAALSKALQLVTTLIPKVLKSPTQLQTAWEFQPPFYNCGFMLPPHAHTQTLAIIHELLVFTPLHA